MELVAINLLVKTIIVGFAAAFSVRAFQTGSIFSGLIANLETDWLLEKSRYVFGINRVTDWFADKLKDLLLCPLCLCPWCCLLFFLAIKCPLLCLPSLWGYGVSQLIEFFVGVLAAAQIAYGLRIK